MTILQVNDVHATYGHVPILMGITFELQNKEILTILGRNGVGKTTLMRVLMGLVKPYKGSVMLDGKLVSHLPTHIIARSGMSYVPQGRGIFQKLTVGENLIVGSRATMQAKGTTPEVIITYFPVLKQRYNQRAGTLSGGEQQMLAIGRALCGKPRIIILDEPSEGIQPNTVRQLGEIMIEIVKTMQISVLLVEQNLDLALSTANRCIIMDMGKIVYQGIPREIEDEILVKEYLAV